MQRDQSVDQSFYYLAGRHVDIAICGGIAATEMVKVIRAIRRWGAEVRVFMTESALKFITPLSLEWASGTKPVTTLSGQAEQIADSDIFLVAPATLNTIQKLVHGIADSPPLTALQAAWGRGIPIVIAPAMHLDLWRNPVFQRNLETLRGDCQFRIVEPIFEEGKAKLASALAIVLNVSSMLNKQLSGRRFLLTGGPTEGKIDAVRVLRNLSSGRLSCLIAQELIANGGEIEFVYGPGEAQPPPGVNLHRVKSVDEMRGVIKNITENKRIDFAIFAAAVLDFAPERFDHKLDSDKPVSISLTPGPKLIDEIRDIPKIGFKLESSLTLSDSVSLAEGIMERRDWEAVVINSVEGIDDNRHEALFVARGGEHKFCKTREEIASAICRFLVSRTPDYQPR